MSNNHDSKLIAFKEIPYVVNTYGVEPEDVIKAMKTGSKKGGKTRSRKLTMKKLFEMGKIAEKTNKDGSSGYAKLGVIEEEEETSTDMGPVVMDSDVI